MTCRICQTRPLFAPPPFDLCRPCATRLGVIPMPPSRRPAAPCQRCNHGQFVRVIPRELGGNGDYNMPAPMAATIRMTIQPSFLSDSPRDPEPREGVGLLEMYICRKCGFVEWNCLNPEDIPLGPEHMAELVEIDGSNPYR